MIMFQPIVAVGINPDPRAGLGPYTKYYGKNKRPSNKYYHSVMSGLTFGESIYSYARNSSNNRCRINTSHFRTWFYSLQRRYSFR